MRDFEILSHLNIFEEKQNQRAQAVVEVEYTEPVEIELYDDGWLEYEEDAFEI